MPKEFQLTPGRWIGGDHPCFIIAEIGQNHQGDATTAKRMIAEAKECGVDCVKFQKSSLSDKFNQAALNRPYKSQHSWGDTYGAHKLHLEFDQTVYKDLQSYAKDLNIAFTASGMDQTSMDFLEQLSVPFLKIGSGDANNFPLLVHTAKKGKPMIISSGMQSMETMKKVYDQIWPINNNICILQCTSAYPTEAQDVNLKVIQRYLAEFKDIPIGYSGHEIGTSISIAAVAMGAKVLERHFTLDKNWKGSDHASSLEPIEFKKLVEEIRTVETALGSSEKCFLPCEIPCYNKLGKSVVAATAISTGEIIKEDQLTIKVAEPKGYKAELWKDLIGKPALRDIDKDESIFAEDFSKI